MEIKELRAQQQEIKNRLEAYEATMSEFVHEIQVRLKSEESSSSTDRLMMDKMREILDHVAPDWYQQVFGSKANRLTPKAQKKVDEMLKILRAEIIKEDNERDLEIQKRRKILTDSMGPDN